MEDAGLLNVYRDLRNKLTRLSRNQNFVCLVTSLSPEGETSRLAVNLGAVIAFDVSRSAIVIDCDANSNVMDEFVANEDTVGLTEFIEQNMDDTSILLNESGIDRLRIVASGEATQTRTEALESTRMKEIVLELKDRYPDRYLFINAPSIRLSSEVQILANISDMVLFQLHPGTVTPQQINEAIEVIGADKVAGVVLRDI